MQSKFYEIDQKSIFLELRKLFNVSNEITVQFSNDECDNLFNKR